MRNSDAATVKSRIAAMISCWGAEAADFLPSVCVERAPKNQSGGRHMVGCLNRDRFWSTSFGSFESLSTNQVWQRSRVRFGDRVVLHGQTQSSVCPRKRVFLKTATLDSFHHPTS